MNTASFYILGTQEHIMTARIKNPQIIQSAKNSQDSRKHIFMILLGAIFKVRTDSDAACIATS